MGLQKIILLHFMVLWLVLETTNCHKLIRNEPTESAENLRKVVMLSSSSNVFSVDAFGAKGDGKTDDSQAFMKSWKKACSTPAATLVVSKNKDYLLKPLTFSGPCKSSITLEISGTIRASAVQSDYITDKPKWLMFQNIQNFTVEGDGIINGNGNIWWNNSCKINKALPCKDAPTALTFYNCNNLVVGNITIQDAQQMHLTFQKCVNVQALNLRVTAPEKSPNTDGIHVTDTTNIEIVNCVIGTGDDCISIENGSQKVSARNITCGPGHGISIGSLGDDNSEAHVSDVVVDTARLTGTTNGVRIKTWQGGSGGANNITFRNIAMNNVKNPIIIDQNYCDKAGPCKEQKSAVQISNVLYNNIKGTSDTEEAITFQCSKSHPCQGITLHDVSLGAANGRAAEALCMNAKLNKIGNVSPICS